MRVVAILASRIWWMRSRTSCGGRAHRSAKEESHVSKGSVVLRHRCYTDSVRQSYRTPSPIIFRCENEETRAFPRLNVPSVPIVTL